MISSEIYSITKKNGYQTPKRDCSSPKSSWTISVVTNVWQKIKPKEYLLRLWCQVTFYFSTTILEWKSMFFSKQYCKWFGKSASWIGVELTRIDNQEDPMDGDNVTLLCRAYLFPSPPEWNYLDIETGKTHLVNLTHVPEGSINILDSWVSKQSIGSKILGLTGVRIETEQVQATGEKMPAFRSRLFLTNVTMDTPTNFGCTATGNEGETKISEQRYSFKINGMQNLMLLEK